MDFLKKLEAELIIDWQALQKESNHRTKTIALKAYYIKYGIYKKSQTWHLELQAPIA
jgi:hypothetical protein